MRQKSPLRLAVAAVELAFLLPFLAFLFVIAVDWARLFYFSLTVTNCARNGALYASDVYSQYTRPYASISEAALADATNLSPSPTVTSATGTDSYGSYTECTVSYTFTTITNFPGVPTSTTLTKTVRMYSAQQYPTW